MFLFGVFGLASVSFLSRGERPAGKAPTDRPVTVTVEDPTPTVLPNPMSHTETQTFLHRPAPRVFQAGPCSSSQVDVGEWKLRDRGTRSTPGDGKIVRCRARSNKRTNRARHGRKRTPGPALGIREGGGGGSED